MYTSSKLCEFISSDWRSLRDDVLVLIVRTQPGFKRKIHGFEISAVITINRVFAVLLLSRLRSVPSLQHCVHPGAR